MLFRSSIVHDLNKTWSKSLKVRLDLIKWETDVYPGFGKNTQDVINKQINDDYDIFIAIFWSKIGTPTEKAASGTLEELDRALAKYRDSDSSIDIMIYFKDEAIPPSKMDLSQLKKIQEVKDELGEKGGLYWTFDSTDDFESLLRSHLSKVAQKWSEKISEESSNQPQKASEPDLDNSHDLKDVLDDESDYGYLDYLEIYEDRMADITAALTSMAEATVKVGKQFNRRTEEINLLQEQGGQANVKQAKKIIKFSCEDMDRYSEVIESKIDTARKSRTEAFDALSKALALQVELQVDSADKGRSDNYGDLEESLEDMSEAAQSTYGGISSFRETVAKFPRLTIQLNKAKKRVVKALDEVLEEINAIVESSRNVNDIIIELKKDKN